MARSMFGVDLRRALLYGDRYGRRQGTRLWIESSLRDHVSVPGLKQPLYLRPDTTDLHVFEEIFLKGQYDLPFSLDPRFIVDGGAYIGISSLFFALRFPGATIVAVEPDPENLEFLRRNVAAYPNIRPVNAGIWGKGGVKLTVANPDAPKWGLRTLPSDSGGLESLSIAQIMKDAGADRIDILKLDIEGAESSVFADDHCCDWLARTDVLVVELHDRWYPGTAKAFYSALQPYQFRQYLRGETVIIEKADPPLPWNVR